MQFWLYNIVFTADFKIAYYDLSTIFNLLHVIFNTYYIKI